MPDDRDTAVRLRALAFLIEQRQRFGEASIPRAVLERGFDFEGTRVPLIGPQGIFKPAVLPDVPLTITTAPPVEHRERPYDDGFTDSGFLRYRYRGTDPNHRDNVGLRTAMQRQTPLIYQCCAICRLRHDELLEAAHILPDIHPFGEPVVPNGLALCKLHHAAFDANIIGVTPDLEVTVRLDVLQEIDGPMLQHGLQGFQGRRIHVPRADDLKPNRDFLAER
jgi:hypothetical protein